MIFPPQNRNGFTLMEVAVSLLILSIFLAAGIALYQKSEQQRRVLITQQRMDDIIRALSTHVESAGRLPCPADPGINDMRFGWEWNVTLNQLTIASATRPVGSCSNVANNPAQNEVTGIVPFQSLNLPPAAIRDGWGRYFTYSVSPVFAQNTDRTGGAVGAELDTNVHAQCRTHAWVNELDTLSSFKARFCCAADIAAGTNFPPGTTDLRIELRDGTGGGTVISPTRVANTPANNETGYNGIATMTTLAVDGRPSAPVHFNAAGESITGPAFVLLSHGENGNGAFIAEGNRDRVAGGGLVGNDEQENIDYDRLYYTGPRRAGNAAATYFDDIVLWMTQDGIMAANGTSSCQYP